MQIMTVEIVNQSVHWVNLQIQLTENVNQDVYHCSNIISDVYLYVQMVIMQIQVVIVFYQVNVI